MNGVHDLGGMQGFGSIQREEDEPVFQFPWEGRVFGMSIALGAHGIHDPDGLRAAVERLDPARYLGSSYYERWLLVIEQALVKKGVLTWEELDMKNGHLKQQPNVSLPRREDPAFTEQIMQSVFTRQSPHKMGGSSPRYQVGDPVYARNLHPRGHTRLPRYVRGKRGVINTFYGVDEFHDSMSEGILAEPQPVYSVRFDSFELWGDSAGGNQSIFIDLWESYLEPA